jgi:hypothetical protein
MRRLGSPWISSVFLIHGMVAEGDAKDRLPGKNRRDAGVSLQQVGGGVSLLRRRILIMVHQD